VKVVPRVRGSANAVCLATLLGVVLLLVV